MQLSKHYDTHLIGVEYLVSTFFDKRCREVQVSFNVFVANAGGTSLGVGTLFVPRHAPVTIKPHQKFYTHLTIFNSVNKLFVCSIEPLTASCEITCHQDIQYTYTKKNIFRDKLIQTIEQNSVKSFVKLSAFKKYSNKLENYCYRCRPYAEMSTRSYPLLEQ